MVLVPTAVAIVNTSNCPLLVRTSWDKVSNEEAVRLVYLMHASLDIVEEKADQPTTRDNFLGLLYQSEQHRIYGLMSTTKVKILLMIGTAPHVAAPQATIASQQQQQQQPVVNLSQPRENDIREILRNIHKVYINATAMNPFYKPNEQIKSKLLDSHLDEIFMKAANGMPTSGTISPIGDAGLVQTV